MSVCMVSQLASQHTWYWMQYGMSDTSSLLIVSGCRVSDVYRITSFAFVPLSRSEWARTRAPRQDSDIRMNRDCNKHD